ncbi:Mu transposase C-terminal domain-containing protein [Paenibacillus oenotherae]|uniref:Mu transposase C-terminal domain-containing protein n=1 Tax=Paenibacillus oenotherae TaxID=1435645 RepID=A0ABS7D566_9BACL|nr:Mu transposase C-terminal domain-containing protein [Paenibacillus oenotherae]MBW7474323.1 Mu transposase C-terminal domain-containing protein [Paenibacillus oenotherae]
MQGFSFVPGIYFRWSEKEFVVRKVIENNDVEVTNLSYDTVEVFSLNELLEAWSDETLVVKRDFKAEEAKITQHDVELLSDEEKQIIELRYKVLEPILSGKVKSREYSEYIDSLPEEQRNLVNSTSTLYRWKRRWEETQDKRSLLPRNDLKGVKTFKVSTDVQDIIERLLVKYDKQGLDVSNRRIHIEMEKEVKEINSTRTDDHQIEPCGRATTNRIIQHLRKTYLKDKARYGVVQANLNKNGSTTEVYVERPLQRVEIDWTPLDLFVVDTYSGKTERFYLIHAVDKATGYGLGYELWLGEPNTKAIKQCMLHAMFPKTHIRSLYPRLQHDWAAYGKPEVIVVDNAKVHDAEDLVEFFSLIGIEVQFCPVKAGHQKGTIERRFRTLNEKVFHSIPGTTFSDPKMRALYDSTGKACLTLKALHEIVHITIVDLVANDYSIALGGTPAFLWEQGLKDWHVHRTLPMQKKDLIMLLSTGIDYRTITNKGIELEGQHFQSSSLMKLFDYMNRKKKDRRVRVRFNPSDMRTIYILDETTNQYIEAYPVKNSLRKKSIDETHPVHIAQLKYYNLRKNKEYNDFDTTHLAHAYEQIEDIIHNSRRELAQLEKLPDDLRAVEHNKHLSSIQHLHEAQLAPEGIETLKIISEKEEETVKDNGKTAVKSKPKVFKKGNSYQSVNNDSNGIVRESSDSEMPPLLFDDDLDEDWDVTV